MKYEITNKASATGFRVVRILDGKFKDVEYVYGGVKFQEEDDILKISFDYDILTETRMTPQVQNEFRHLIGEYLLEILRKQAEEGEVVYYGGRGGSSSSEN